MARRATSLTGLFLGLTMLAAAGGGCESTPSASADLPSPNFNAPPLAAQPAPRLPTVVPPTAASSARATPPASSTGVPRDWTPVVRANNWRWIVIHHSATGAGSVAAFDRMHKQKGWDECGYHFVIGNGTESRDGQVEVGPRWPKQKWGAHAKTADNRFNDYGIGVCLVGNFDVSRPTARQHQELARLVAHLMKTYNIPPERVIGHRDAKATECPGRYMNIAVVRQQARQALADAGEPIPAADVTLSSATELLHPTPGDRTE
jgi:hypothetical protein